MCKPVIKHLVTSPNGDIAVEGEKLEIPLEGDSLKTPYKFYFQAIEDFLQTDKFEPIIDIINEINKKRIYLRDISKIFIRAEKHGALYHPASIEIIQTNNKSVKFGLNVALTEIGKTSLKNEFEMLKNLNLKYKLPYLPEPYLFSEINSVAFLLEEWFEDFYEFHLGIDENGRKTLNLWEFGKGYKFLSEEHEFEVYKEVAKILTLYYDIYEFKQIYPWHHAAGDFIARINNEGIELRLTTVRDYKPFMQFGQNNVHPFLPLFYFFLDLSIRTRLDKLDGIGEVLWANKFTVKATIDGFLEALALKEARKDTHEIRNKFLNLLRSFGKEDLYKTCNPVLELYKGSKDFPIVINNLDKHIEELYITLQNLPS